MLRLEMRETLDIPLILSDCIVRNYLAVDSLDWFKEDVCILFLWYFMIYGLIQP